MGGSTVLPSWACHNYYLILYHPAPYVGGGVWLAIIQCRFKLIIHLSIIRKKLNNEL